MNFAFSKLYSKDGRRLQHPTPVPDCVIDLDEKTRTLCVFSGGKGGSLIAELYVMELGIHAEGIRAKGVEGDDATHRRYQEYWFAWQPVSPE